MNAFDDLPKRDRNRATEAKAEQAFQSLLVESDAFILQSADRKDYGTDCQIEVVEHDRATNVRLHVQLKGSERPLNADGSMSVEIARANLNYLLAHPLSFYVAYHAPTGSLRFCSAESVLRRYEHGGKDWTAQQTLTVTFIEALTPEYLIRLAQLARTTANVARDRRLEQLTAEPGEAARLIRRAVPDVHVPENPLAAARLLEELYARDDDDVISAAFDRFASVIGNENDRMGPAFMAEINLMMAGRGQHPARVHAAIDHFRAKLDGGRYTAGSLHYTIGNALSALGDEQGAKASYEEALADPALRGNPDLLAQVFKNLGTSFERLGQQDAAIALYYEALRLRPDLAEAHNALGNHLVQVGRFEEALEHFDQVLFLEPNPFKSLAAAGWRANILFNLGDGRAAFRDINLLLRQVDNAPWILPWCGRQVAAFGRRSPEDARRALAFWPHYIRELPEHGAARGEYLLTGLYLRGKGHDLGKSYAAFRAEFDTHIDHLEPKDAAFLWDRLGHWAQEEKDWVEAERCFRKAHDLDAGDYGYCLGTALNVLNRFNESLPLLIEQASSVQPDAHSWFQVGVAYAGLDRSNEAIDAFERAAALDPDDADAIFSLGGQYWNLGETGKAREIWSAARLRFPAYDFGGHFQPSTCRSTGSESN